MEKIRSTCLNNKKRLKYGLLILLILAGVAFCTISVYVALSGKQYIYSVDKLPEVDAVLVLGAYVFPDGTLSNMLNDRLLTGYELYALGKAHKILVSGDHGQRNYDEVNAMKTFMLKGGVPGQDVFMDHAGFSTYESIYRARDIFKVKKLVIVTQDYHLRRAVFIARELGLEAYGAAADRHDYGPVMYQYRLREMLARNKDFFLAVIIKPQPTFLGEVIPVSGDGRTTDDKY
ncbi:MAG: ElyC/SanA/YdcF family protein [Syntrophomonadaceae bacterium]|nr:ElyC/SanA/YdcF family protein [Syntrophomonadaceae bacterium]